MPWVDVVWTAENEAHLGAHQVSRQEAEFVLRNPVGHDVSESSSRPIIFGYTAAGPKLAVVYERVDDMSVYPITAFDVE